MADEFPPFDDIPRDHQDADETPQLSAFHYDDLMNPAPPAPAFLSLVATSAPVAIPGQRSNGMQIAPEPATSSGSATAAAMPVLTTSPRARIAGASTIGVSTQPIQADVDQLLTLIASCLSGRLVQGVRDMTVMLTQSAVQSRSTSINPNLRETELEQHLTRHLKKMLGGDRVYNLGVRPVISIAIGPGHGARYFNPTPTPPNQPASFKFVNTFSTTSKEPSYSLQASPDNRAVIPGKLLQKSHIAVAFTPTTPLIKKLGDMIKASIEAGVLAHGQSVSKTFSRIQALSQENHGHDMEGLCPFRLAEVEFVLASAPVPKTVITDLDWVCEVCGGRHRLEVVE